MKKQINCVLSLVLVIALMLSLSVPAFAETTGEVTVDIWDVEDGTIRLTEEVKESETIIRQYDNGILTSTVHIPSNPSSNNTVTLTVETLSAKGKIIKTEYISVNQMVPQNNVVTLATPVALGTLQYSTSDGQKTINVKYSAEYFNRSTVRLPSGTTTISTLVSILKAGVRFMKTSLATTIIKWLLNIMGIAASAASFAFPGRELSCEQTNFTYHLTNGSNSAHTNQFTSYYYYINDDRSANASYNGTSKIDGWTPSTARTQTTPFAQTCYTYMFEGSYSVIGWV